MRKAAIIAVVAIGSSLAVYGVFSRKQTEQQAKTECCDKLQCCPMGGMDNCCEYGCE